jgi:hypothetical protein
MQDTILIFTPNITNRLIYTSNLVFEQHLGIKVAFTGSTAEFDAFNGAKIIYAALASGDFIHIAPHPLLFETAITKQHFTTCSFKGLNVPFATRGQSFPFDVFAAIFYMISRYEEYLPFVANQYDQFKAADSLAYKMGFLDKPVVDIWINYLKDELTSRYPFLKFKQKKFTTTFTYDIDVAYAYKGRNFFVTAGRLLQQCITGNLTKTKERWLTLCNRQDDPFDTYYHILQQLQVNGHNLVFFFLVGPQTKYNRNLKPTGKLMTELITKISTAAATGLHPSYYTNTNYKQLQQEKYLLESIAAKKITSSRQHYLRLSFPQTYCLLIDAGITADYTLGFAEMPGFRAGTCTPFNFYNLKNEEATALTLYPNTFMEGSFTDDMQLAPQQALPEMQRLVDEVKRVNGHFICIWHNHSLSNINQWKGLKAVHDAIALYARQQ